MPSCTLLGTHFKAVSCWSTILCALVPPSARPICLHNRLHLSINWRMLGADDRDFEQVLHLNCHQVQRHVAKLGWIPSCCLAGVCSPLEPPACVSSPAPPLAPPSAPPPAPPSAPSCAPSCAPPMWRQYHPCPRLPPPLHQLLHLPLARLDSRQPRFPATRQPHLCIAFGGAKHICCTDRQAHPLLHNHHIHRAC